MITAIRKLSRIDAAIVAYMIVLALIAVAVAAVLGKPAELIVALIPATVAVVIVANARRSA